MSSCASSYPTATPISIATLVSSAISVRTAVSRSSTSGLPAASSTAAWWAEPNQSAACSASLRIRWMPGALAPTMRWASSSRSGSESAWIAASTSASE